MVDLRMGRIAAVTAGYPRMRIAIISALPAPLCVPFIQASFAEDVVRVFAWGLALIAGLSVTAYLAPRLLDGRFGRLESGKRRMVSSGVWGPPIPLWQACGPMLGGIGLSVVTSLDDWSLATGGPSVLMFVLAGIGLWLAAKDWTVRKHLLIFVAVCGAGAVILPAASRTDALPVWRANACAAAALSWMVVGLLDFLTLRRVLAPNMTPEMPSAA
jgi:hypothetical protein